MEFTDDELSTLAALIAIRRGRGGWFLDEIEAHLGWPEMFGARALQGLIEKGLVLRVGLGDQFDLTDGGWDVIRDIEAKASRQSRR